MKNQVFATLSCLTLLTATGAVAQSAEVLTANIPFEFRVGTTILPAGEYQVRPQRSPGLLSLRCFECKAGAMILADAVDAPKLQEASKLVFNRYGTTYFLATVWTAGYSQGRELRKTKAESEYARNDSAVSPVIVALARR